MKRQIPPLATAPLLAVALASAASAQAILQYRPYEGKTSVTTTIKAKQVLTIAGMEVPTDSDVVSRSEVTSTKPAADGTYRLAEKTVGIRLKLATPGGSVDFDSDKPDSAAGTPFAALGEGLAALKGTAYTIVVKDGKAVEVEGLDQVRAKIPASAAELFKDELKPETIKRDWQQQLDIVPGKDVKKGDTWQRTEVVSLGGGQTFTFDTQYEYQGTIEKDGRKLEKLGILYTTVKYAVDGAALGGVKVTGNDLKIESSFGHVLFDPAQGYVVERSTTTRVVGPIALDLNGMQLGGKVDLTLAIGSVSKR